MTTYMAIDINGSITSGLNTVAKFIPALVLFIVVMVIGWIIARVLRTVITKVLTKVGFDKVADRGGLNKFLGSNTASSLVGRLVYYAILLFALQLGLAAFGPNPVTNLISGVVNFLPKLFVAIIIVVVAAAIGKVVHDLITGALGGVSYGNIIGRLAQAFILGMGVIAALNQIQVATSVIEPVFIAILAIIVGVAIVGVGGGLIGPMRQRWERMLTSAEGEAGTVQESIRSRSAQHDVQTERTRTGGQPAREPQPHGAATGTSAGGASGGGASSGGISGGTTGTAGSGATSSRETPGQGAHTVRPDQPPTDPPFGGTFRSDH